MIYLLLRPSARTRENAVALLIVLAFLVLLAGITVAYLSRTGTDRQIAHSSFNDAKADQLARSALEIVVADFKQEIANAGIPPTNANIVPQRSLKPASGSTPAIPNLVRLSVRSDNISAPAIASRASAVSSTTDVSLNGRSISSSRWNSHYLVPRLNASSTTADSAPIASFTPPDWVLVCRAGPAVQNSIGSGGLAINNASVTNTNFVIGRYAYAVYDEGGLLDANLVGLPSPSPTVTDVGRKGHVAFADLTAMKLTSAGTTPNPTTISKMVAWRNYATLQSSGTFAALSPTPSAAPFTNYFLDPSRDFRTVSTTIYNNKTDQAFITRKQLIDIFQGSGAAGSSGINGSYNMLQFLGTFSREKNLPTWTAGTAALTQRFALGNLSLVKANPSSSSASDIQKYFGLQWTAGTSGTPITPGHWKYVGSTGSVPRSSIPAFPNNPEFFQLLNYAMHATNSDDAADVASTLAVGAAIIDQYDDSTSSDPLTTTTTTMIEYAGGWALGMETVDPARSPTPVPAGMSPTPPPAISGYVMLNRPFRNIGEFGYAYKQSSTRTDKTIDFTTGSSADAPILDLFTYNTASVRAGVTSLNTQNPAVIASILKSTITSEASSSLIGLAASNNAAESPTPAPNTGVIGGISSGSEGTLTKAALGRQDITRLVAATGTTISSSATSDEGKESVARALAEVTQTRTWGLLIDLIAQSGRYPPTASTLSDFVVEGEKRYWLHVAIDRFTGEVIDQQLEEVFE